MSDPQHPDDTEVTRRHEVPAEPQAWPATPATSAAPATPATPATPGSPGSPGLGDSVSPGVERYSPPSEPRNDWSRHGGDAAPATTPERWYEPAALAGSVPTTPV